MFHLARLHECHDGRSPAADIAAQRQTSTDARHRRGDHIILAIPFLRCSERLLIRTLLRVQC